MAQSLTAATAEKAVHILAIDDDPEILRGYLTLFGARPSCGLEELLSLDEPVAAEKPGRFQLDAASSGEKGVEMLRDAISRGSPYQIILLDMRMPGGIDGLQTAQQIRAVDPGLPIILISAFRDYTLERMREEIGEQFMLYPKPYIAEELFQLTTLLAHQQGVTVPFALAASQPQC
jgi:CheY-like chemotaxis protein